MFTGIVETTGTIRSFEPNQEGARIELEIPFASELALGDSVATNGCCLTIAELIDGGGAFDLLAQTLRVTGLGDLAVGDPVNLERALSVDARLGGHFVQSTGSNTMWFALLWIIPAQDIAIVVATNSGQPNAFPSCDKVVAAVMAAFSE